MDLINIILHIDTYLTDIVNVYGALSYILLFATIFIETGLVFMPFLPGDSLLFAAGAISAISSLNICFLIVVLFLAAFLGDTTNYFIGKYFGEKISNRMNQKYLIETQDFYNKYGGTTIFLARFVPIVRTFAPFVAGLGKMDYKKFIAYNATGGLAWVLLFTLLGYFLGNTPQIKANFSIIVILIILISLIPVAFKFIKKSK
ncbi:MAG TPA: VTT domain-containing protein [Candidatus Pacearchaeota archaeon]|nr:VTT domain-containing protein [Candidatus Pacearchaeota archaeon]HPR79696.1 VTT domain-containing protein [Candidatus Pacearchaeota archaeon]